MVGFTRLASQISPTELIVKLNSIFSEFDQLTERYGLEKNKTIGDGYMVASGLPNPRLMGMPLCKWHWQCKKLWQILTRIRKKNQPDNWY
ncbi:adenylate/guanylate cyclase domain-containing protein [Microseira sp. BLCC-F43]|jgi:hypothetical protein|uniref:adenylate/guanylate cyclase domain-containing protein n=1 Tax=Microseira sp. BLCC-F43 TaxID=3153602 RepID=UPI0035B8D21A